MRSNLVFLIGYGLFSLAGACQLGLSAFYLDLTDVGVLALFLASQVLLSQLLGFGQHFSALYYFSLGSSGSLFSSWFNVLLITCCISILLFPIADLALKNWMPKEFAPFIFLLFVVSGLIASNKVFYAELNALGNYSKLGLVYTIRALSIFAGFVTISMVGSGLNIYLLMVVLLPEVLTYIWFTSEAILRISKFHFIELFVDFRRNFMFGLKSFWGAFFLDTTTKVDLLLLGMLSNTTLAGVYGLVSLYSDFIYQFSTYLRTMLNPELARRSHIKTLDFISFVKDRIRRSYYQTIPLVVICFIGFIIFIDVVPGYQQFNQGVLALLIMAISLAIYSGYLPLLQTFGQMGLPGLQSMTYAVLFFSNVALNLFFIPWLGIEGAALATGLSYIGYILLFEYLLRKRMPMYNASSGLNDI